MARLVYLVASHQIKIPEPILKYLPAGEWIGRLHKGPSAAGFTSQALLKKYRALYQVGNQMGRGSKAEASALMLRLLDEGISQRQDLTGADRAKIYGMMERFIASSDSMLSAAETGIFSLNKAPRVKSIPKFMTGFTPLDEVLRGFYQGIFVLMGKPGTGKTSVCISLHEAIVRSKDAPPTLFVQNELPQTMMLGRMEPARKRTKYRDCDILITQSWGATEILTWVEENPNPDRILIFDSPDVTAGGGDEKRFYLENEYQTLVRIKQKCKAIIATSQPRRKDARGVLSIESVAEAWAKAWYADAIIGMARTPNGLRFSVLKNRFGITDQSVITRYDYETLEWEPGEIETLDDW